MIHETKYNIFPEKELSLIDKERFHWKQLLVEKHSITIPEGNT